VQNPVKDVLRTGATIGLANHTILISRTGTETPVGDSAAPIRNTDGSLSGVVLVFRDVTDQRIAHRLQAHLAAIVEFSGDVILTKDLNGIVQSWNASAERLFGYRAEEIIGKPITTIFPTDRLNEENYILERLRQGQPVERLETIRVAKNGTLIPVSVSVSPLKDAEGRLVGASKIIHNITELVAAREALRQANERLSHQNDHLENIVQERTARLNGMVSDLEAFSYSIVHDMRAPLRAMQSFAELLAEECGPLTPVAQDFISRIQSSAVRLDRLLQDGLSYTRIMGAEFPLKPTDVRTLAHEIINNHPPLQSPNAEILVDDDLPLVLANEAGLTQCISNLLFNAVKFVSPGVKPNVRVRAQLSAHRVRLIFSDNGIGIAKGSQHKIFQMFQRLHSKYEGTGIGLAIVKRAAERMGGNVGVESEPGKGSNFWLELRSAAATQPS
jgi:PAS domain S-box-containing protein